MGLDMYAYAAKKSGQHARYFEQDNITFDSLAGQWTGGDPSVEPTEEIAYWRKHPNLHGWMERLWDQKGQPGAALFSNPAELIFNGVELELTLEDLDRLEADVVNKRLPATTGFFFGNTADKEYREQDLEFIRKARAVIDNGGKVFYNSSW